MHEHFSWVYLTLICALPAQQAKIVDLTEELERIRVTHAVPALGAAVLEAGVVTRIGAAGVRRSGSDERVTVADKWHLGSCTKAMTATLFGLLVEADKVAWDTTLPTLFADLELHEDLAEVTLTELLSHRSGLMRDPLIGDVWQRLYAWDGAVRDARTLVAKSVLELRPSIDPGTRYVYSNTGYMVAGAALERIVDEPWESAMRKRLFEPLEMHSAGFGPPGEAGSLTQPRGHKPDGEPVEPDGRADNPPALGPAGTVHASLGDWAKFIDLHIRGARGEEDLLLSADTLRTMQRPVGGDDYALGWEVTRRRWSEGPILTHNGTNNMWYCTVWIAPQDSVALLATCNQGGDAAATACNAACVLMLKQLGKL